MISTTMARLSMRNPSCQWSVSTLTRTRVAVKSRMTRARDQINLGVVRNLWPKSPLRTRKVTLGTMAAMARSEVNSSCKVFLTPPSRLLWLENGEGVVLLAIVLNLYIQ